MYSSKQKGGIQITINFYTKNRTLFKIRTNPKNTLNSILVNFEKNPRYKNEAKVKSKYFLNGKEIRKNQLIEEILKQNSQESLSSLDQTELFIELEDKHFNGDSLFHNYKKIILPKSNPFSLYIYSPKEKIITMKTFPDKTIKLFELQKYNEGSSFCNSYYILYISGGNDNNKDFWMINNNTYEIKKKNMPTGKKNHSMIYLNFNGKDEWVFMAGGNDKKSLYYDLKKNYFINWGETNENHIKPALIQVGEYLYIFDSINLRKNYFERTKIISPPNRKWEKIVPEIDNKIISTFPSNFGVSYDSKGNIIFLGGDNINILNNTYIYEPGKNSIILSQIGTNDNLLLGDKTFYKLNDKYSVGFPSKLNEVKEICVVDKEDQSIIKISLENTSDNNEFKVISEITFDEKNQYFNRDNGDIIIKTSEKGINDNFYDFEEQKKDNQLNNKNDNLYNQKYNGQNNLIQGYSLNPLICDNCINRNNFICQCCHNPMQIDNYKSQINYKFQKDHNQNEYINNYNFNYNQNNEPYFIPTKENPRIIVSQDEYFPTLSSSYQKMLKENKMKSTTSTTTYKKVYNKNYNRVRDKAKVEITYDEYSPLKVDYVLNKPGSEIKNYIYERKEKKEIKKTEEENYNKKENKNIENKNLNNRNIENDVVEYKNFEKNEPENKDDDLYISDEQNQHQNEVIIEENHNNIESNYNEDLDGQPEQHYVENENVKGHEILGKGLEQYKEKQINGDNNGQQINKEEFIDVDEQHIDHRENDEDNIEQLEHEHIDEDKGEYNGETDLKEDNNNIINQNKGIINGELPKDSLEFNDAGKIHEAHNNLKMQQELDFNRQEINDHIQEINIQENKNDNINDINNDNVIRDGEEFHSMNENEENVENVEEQNNSVQQIESGNNEEMYENGKEIKFDKENENMEFNGEENQENINNDDEENKIVEFQGEGEDEGEEGMNVEEVEVQEENNGEEGEMNGNEEEINLIEGDEEEMNYEEEGEEMNYEEGNEEGGEEEMNYEEEGEEEMNYEEEGEEGNNSMIENNIENDEHEHEQNNDDNEGEGENFE